MSKGISESTVEEIKARVDLADLISSYGIQIKTAGTSKKACCPFHHEKTPSFNINDTKGFYHCFGCGESGDAIKFVMKYEGLSFIDAVKKLADQVGVRIEETVDPRSERRGRLLALLAELAQFYHRCLNKAKEAQIARDYLAKRSLDEAVQKAYLIGYAPIGIAPILKWAEKYGYSAEELEDAGVIKGSNGAGDLGYHRFGGRLMFAICDKRGRVVGFSGRQLVESKMSGKYVNSPETAVFKKSNVLYGLDKALAQITKSPNREVIVCEGQIDCIRLQISGFPNSVAGQGTAFTEAHVAMLRKVADQVALVYDDDAAGHKATIKSARLCLAVGLPVRVVSLPNGDDPDSFLRTHSENDFRTMLDGAESIVSFQVRVERAKEKVYDTLDAVNRISKAVLLTISSCANAILKAAMLDEMAKHVNLPRAALAEELAKMRLPAEVSATTSLDDDDLDDEMSADDAEYVKEDSIVGAEAKSVMAPPAGELGFCAFLLAHEYAEEASKISELIGEFLPRFVFASDFAANFVEAWRAEIAQGGDIIAPWSDALSAGERKWFDCLLVNQNKDFSSTLTSVERMRDWVAILWSALLKRRRGCLPAIGDDATENLRLKLTMDIRRTSSVKWSTLKDLIRDWIMHYGSEGSN